MNATEKYEVQAEAFRQMTGFLAPGKSQSIMQGGIPTDEERRAAWEVWGQAYGPVVRAMLSGFESVMGRPEE